jgi:hypothetical protein
MKFILIGLLTLVSHNIYANTTGERVLTCTFTKNMFGAMPEITKSFKFIEKPGYLPIAEGSFNVSSENVVVHVSSNLIKMIDEKSEYVKTSMTINSNQITISTGFSSKIDEQLSYLELNNSGIVICIAN